MISLKAIQTSVTPNHGLFHERDFLKKRKLILSFCKNNNSDNADQEAPPPEGDKSKQELLARIAMLQAQKVRLTDYLDEKSAYLTQFAEEANAEIDQIGENALRELDEAGARIMENIESRMQAFEESAESNKLEIEKNEKIVEEFEGRIAKDRNEGLFFKNLGQKTLVEKAKKSKEEADKNAGAVIRRNIYLVLIGLVVVSIIDGLVSSTSDWRKVAGLGVLFVGLVSQLTYEQNMLSEKAAEEQEKTKEDNE